MLSVIESTSCPWARQFCAVQMQGRRGRGQLTIGSSIALALLLWYLPI